MLKNIKNNRNRLNPPKILLVFLLSIQAPVIYLLYGLDKKKPNYTDICRGKSNLFQIHLKSRFIYFKRTEKFNIQ